MTKRGSILLALLILVLAAAPALAQPRARGSLAVIVSLRDGQRLPGVRVELVGVKKERTKYTDASGQVNFPLLRKGVYEVRATIEGMRPLIRPNILIEGGGVVRLTLIATPVNAAP